jgi:hypothetical protein
MSPEFFNMYVEKLVQETTELTKVKILLSTQVSYYEKINAELTTKVEDLEKALNKATTKSQKKNESNSDF